ncbi:hypothetical protein OROGR_013302 [Orobanche gracilis]
MVGRKLTSLLKNRSRTAGEGEAEGQSLGLKIVSGALICLTGGVALSALDDLLIYYGCTSKAMESASKNQAIIEAIGEPIVRGPWYNASLAVNHKRQSLSCSFPASGPHGSGMFQLKAVRNRVKLVVPQPLRVVMRTQMLESSAGLNESSSRSFRGDSWFSYLWPRDWEILIMEARLHTPANEKHQQNIRISVSDNPPPPACKTCPRPQPTESVENNHPQTIASPNPSIT